MYMPGVKRLELFRVGGIMFLFIIVWIVFYLKKVYWWMEGFSKSIPLVGRNNMGTCYVWQLPYDDDIKAQLNELVELVLKSDIDCERIVLFGSYARMEYTVGSDFDILVLSYGEIPREVKGGLRSVFDEKNSDLVFYVKSVFDASTCLLADRIRREGIMLWKS